MKNIEHGLDGRISPVAGQMLLHGLHIRGPGFPQDVHYFQLEGRQVFSFSSRHQVSTPKSLGA